MTLRWQNEPAGWSFEGEEQRLRLEPKAGTDFWQKTHYGFEADTGHFLCADVTGDLVMTTRVRMQPCHQYDQAGLMVRLSAACWIKTSVEHEPGRSGRLGAVVTNHGYSDWSTQSFAGEEFWLRVRREGRDYIVDSSSNGSDWEQIRMAHLHEDDGLRPVACGLYACSPKGAGFAAQFSYLSIERGRVTS
jgi:regulation of enolase protein 1 (concanavalin A-like superfamily)